MLLGTAVIEMDCNWAPVIISERVPLTPKYCAVIVELPVFKPVNTPLDVTDPPTPVVHFTKFARFEDVPSE